VITVNIPAVSYAIGAAAFVILSLLLLTAWRGRLQGGLLVSSTVVTGLWCAAVAFYAVYRVPPFSALQLLEVLRDATWCLFLLKLLGLTRKQARGSARGVQVLAMVIFALCAGLAAIILANRYSADILAVASMTAYIAIFGHVLLAVAGLVLVEQIYRNTPPDQRWAIKFLCIGVGGLFVYDFYMYANGLLFKQFDGAIWSARGVVFAMVVPLIAVSASRNPQWSLRVFVSRHVVFHSAALLGAGVYLLIMAAAGYYIKAYGGSWGGVVQIAFLCCCNRAICARASRSSWANISSTIATITAKSGYALPRRSRLWSGAWSSSPPSCAPSPISSKARAAFSTSAPRVATSSPRRVSTWIGLPLSGSRPTRRFCAFSSSASGSFSWTSTRITGKATRSSCCRIGWTHSPGPG
jgi:hypothetical protein